MAINKALSKQLISFINEKVVYSDASLKKVATNEGAYRTLSQACEDLFGKDSIDIIHPATANEKSPISSDMENAFIGSVVYGKQIQEIIYKNGGSLTKPIIAFLPNKVELKSGEQVLLWQALLILPKKHQTLNGEQNNSNHIVYFISQGLLGNIPATLRHILSEGISYEYKIASNDKLVQIKKLDHAEFRCVFFPKQMGVQDSAWWALYSIIMILMEGDASLLEKSYKKDIKKATCNLKNYFNKMDLPDDSIKINSIISSVRLDANEIDILQIKWSLLSKEMKEAVFQNKKEEFIKSFTEFTEDDLKAIDEISSKRREPELDENFRKAMLIADWAAAGVDAIVAANQIPVSIGTLAFLPIKAGINMVGKNVANKKNKRAERAFANNQRYELKLMLWEAIREIVIAYEYQLDRLLGRVDVKRFAAGAVSRLVNYFKENHSIEQREITRELIIEAILKGKGDKKGKLLTDIDKLLYNQASAYSHTKKIALKENACRWNMDSIFAKVGLVTRQKDCLVKEHANTQKYGYRRELLISLDREYKDLDPNPSLFQKDYDYYFFLIEGGDLLEYAKLHRKNELEEAKGTLNDYIIYKYKLNRKIQAVCRSLPTGVEIDLSQADLSDSDLLGINLEGANLEKAILKNAILGRANLKNANLEEADCEQAYLAGALLTEAKLAKANLSRADLTCASLDSLKSVQKLVLIGAKVEGLTYNYTDLSQAITDANISKVIISQIESEKENREKVAAVESDTIQLEGRVRKLEEAEGGKMLLIKDLDQVVHPISHYYKTEYVVGLEQAFEQKNTALVVGISGSGKTQLARYFSYEIYKKKYPNCLVFELASESLNSLEKSYRMLATFLYPKEKIEQKSIDEIYKCIMKRLKEEKSFLLVFDNVQSKDVKDSISRLIPCELKNGFILITSQDSNLPYLIDAVSLHMIGWNEIDVIDYLGSWIKKYSQAPFTKEEAIRIGEIFDYLPLGIDCARLYIRAKHISVETYLQRLQEESIRQIVEQEEERLIKQFYEKKDGYRSQKAAVRLSLEELEKEDPLAFKLLKFCSFLSADTIPFLIIRNFIQSITGETNSLLLTPKTELLLEALERYSLLIKIEGTDDGRTVYLHRLVQNVTREGMQTEQKHEMMKKASELLKPYFTRDNRDVSTFNKNTLYLNHVDVLLAHAETYKLELNPDLAYLEIARGVYYDFCNEHFKAEQLLEKCKASLRQMASLAEGDSATSVCEKTITYSNSFPTLYAQMCYHLGKTKLSRNSSECIKDLDMAVAIREIIDSNPKAYCDDFNEGNPRPMDSIIFKRNGTILALSLQDIHDSLMQAKTQYQELIDEELKLPSNLQDKFNLNVCQRGLIDILIKLTNVGITEGHEGHKTEALKRISELEEVSYSENSRVLAENIDKALEARKEKDKRIAREYVLVGRVYLLQNTPDAVKQAEIFFKKALEIENVNKTGAFIKADALYGLALVYNQQNRFTEARETVQDCIGIREKSDPRYLSEAKKLKVIIELNLDPQAMRGIMKLQQFWRRQNKEKSLEQGRLKAVKN